MAAATVKLCYSQTSTTHNIYEPHEWTKERVLWPTSTWEAMCLPSSMKHATANIHQFCIFICLMRCALVLFLVRSKWPNGQCNDWAATDIKSICLFMLWIWTLCEWRGVTSYAMQCTYVMFTVQCSFAWAILWHIRIFKMLCKTMTGDMFARLWNCFMFMSSFNGFFLRQKERVRWRD